jgi:ArsR family transcriptional regulator, virulence genes transcriptional regulator
MAPVIPTEKPKVAPDQRASCLRLANRLKVVSGAPQLTVLMQLGQGERSVGDLNASLGGTLSTTSRHLSVLRLEGIVVPRRDSHWVLYSLTDEGRAVLQIVEILLADTPDQTR